MGPRASRSSILWGFADASDGLGRVDVLTVFSRSANPSGRIGDSEGRLGRWRPERSVACRAMPTEPISVRWTLHALDKAQQLGFARHDVEEALLSGHREHRRNRGEAAWLVTAGRLAIAYEHPDGDDPLVACVVTVWRQR